MALHVPKESVDPDSMLVDFDTRFIQKLRTEAPAQWVDKFAYKPAINFENVEVDFPVDLTTFGMTKFEGKWSHRQGTATKLRMSIDAFQDGIELDVNRLRSERSAEIILWDQRQAKLINSFMHFMPPKIYAALLAGKTTGTWWTGGANFFATDHYVNPHKTSLNTFSNLLNGGGAKAASPWYMVIRGGLFNELYPWAILTGVGLGPAIQRAGGMNGVMGAPPAAGEPWVLRWGTDHPNFVDNGFKVKTSIYSEKGWSPFFPHVIIRNEGEVTYANLKDTVNKAAVMKDLEGRMSADQIQVSILCEPGDVSTMNEILGREVVNVGAATPTNAQSAIDTRLKAAEVIALSR